MLASKCLEHSAFLNSILLPLTALNLKNLQIPFYFVVMMWIPYLFEVVTTIDLAQYGLYPREWSGLMGIFTAPFLHGDLDHLWGNSLPMLILGALTYHFYKPIFYKAYFYIILFEGVLVWLFARSSYHIGASGLIYGLASLLFFSGMFRKSYRLVAVSLVIVFLYGSLIWGILPIKPGVSWESHLFGGLVGAALAFRYRKWVFVKRKVYRWENDEEDIRRMESVYGERYWENPPVEDRQIAIRYFFKPREEDT